MAIIKMVKNKSKTSHGLKAVLKYITNEVKTKGVYVTAQNCMSESAYAEMMTIKNEFYQNTGRQYIQIIQSFDVTDDISPETANEIGRKLISTYPEFQAVVATHTNKKHIHNHIVLNTVNITNGRKWQQSKKDLEHLKELSDDLCKEYDLHVIDKSSKGFMGYGEYKNVKSFKGWKHRIATIATDCAMKSESRADFIHLMAQQNIDVQFFDESISFTMPDGKKCGNKKLSQYGDFSSKNLYDWFNVNSNFNTFKQFEPEFLNTVLYTLSQAEYGDAMAVFDMCLITAAVILKAVSDRCKQYEYEQGDFKPNNLLEDDEDEWEL